MNKLIKKYRNYFLIPLFFTGYCAIAQEVETTRKFGIEASFQSSQLDILFTPFISEKTTTFIGFGFSYTDKNSTDFAIGIIPRFYLVNGKVAPYISGRIGGLFHIPVSGDKQTDIITGVAFGGEYFIDPHFSFGAEVQLNSIFLNVNNPVTAIQTKTVVNTGSVLFGTIYF